MRHCGLMSFEVISGGIYNGGCLGAMHCEQTCPTAQVLNRNKQTAMTGLSRVISVVAY